MTINGVDITREVSIICSSVWIVLYFVLIWFVWTRKPKTLAGRCWKASWLIGGLPIFGLPLIMIPIALGMIIFNGDFTNFEISNILGNWASVYSSMMALICISVPIFSFMAVFAVLGTYFRFRNGFYYWLDKIVPPSKEEKPDSIVWY